MTFPSHHIPLQSLANNGPVLRGKDKRSTANFLGTPKKRAEARVNNAEVGGDAGVARLEEERHTVLLEI